jgi:hypothetical protein
MMGDKTPRETRDAVRKAFARTGRDAIQWLERELRRLEKQPKPDASVIKSLERLRDALAKVAKKSTASRRRTRAGS